MLLILAMPFLLISMFGGDAIAGERERHTLETLLDSRISDRAILLGKIMVMVGTAWGMARARLLLGLLSANRASGPGRWAFYGSFGLLVEALALSRLTSLLATSVGVVISLRAATVRQAQQLVLVAALVLLVGVAVGIPVLPP
jgi:ABC-2 type transport system permease protein